MSYLTSFEVSLLLLSFLFVFEGGYEKLAKTRLEQVTAVQSWNHQNYLAAKFCFVFFTTFIWLGERCEMSLPHKLFVIMHLWKCVFILHVSPQFIYSLFLLLFTFFYVFPGILIYALCKRFSLLAHQHNLS